MQKETVVLTTIATILTIIATSFGLSRQFITKDQFEEFRSGTTNGLEKRMDSMDKKLDRLLEHYANRNR